MNKEIKIGFFSLLAIIVLIIGINYLKGINILNSNKTYYAKYDNIGGLKIGSSLFINGYQIGMVSDIQLLKNQNLLVSVSSDHDIEIPNNSILSIVNQDIMGTKAVELILGDNNIKAKNGDTLVSSVQSSLQDDVNKQILPLKIKTEDLIGSIDSVMKIITAVLNKDTRNNLSNSLNSLDLTFNLMSETMFKVNGIIDENDERITSIFKNLEKSNDNITSILSNLSSLSDDLANSNIKLIISDLNAITQKINSSEGSLGLLINNKDIYQNLEKSTKALEDLIDDIKNNPKRYVSFSIIGSNSNLKK